jgi:hypothetical protein
MPFFSNTIFSSKTESAPLQRSLYYLVAISLTITDILFRMVSKGNSATTLNTCDSLVALLYMVILLYSLETS